METMSQPTADGQPEKNRQETGNIETISTPTTGNPSLFQNGLSASDYLGSLLGIDSKMDGLSIEPSQLLPSEREPETCEESSKPLVIDLFSGSFGWSAGFVSEGYRSIGFDILHED